MHYKVRPGDVCQGLIHSAWAKKVVFASTDKVNLNLYANPAQPMIRELMRLFTTHALYLQ